MAPAEILRMIEVVDPDDRKSIFLLNEKVFEWLISIKNGIKFAKFVSSRDALKAIRPEGWAFDHIALTDGDINIFGYSCLAYHRDFDRLIESPDTLTEELAELHAIIQAIEYERQASTVREG